MGEIIISDTPPAESSSQDTRHTLRLAPAVCGRYGGPHRRGEFGECRRSRFRDPERKAGHRMAIRHTLRIGGFAAILAIAPAVRADEPTYHYPESQESITPVVAKVTSAAAPIKGEEAFPKMVAEAKAAYAKTRDYSGHIVRQERVGGTLLAEQSGEIRVRTQPFSINVKMQIGRAHV